MSMTDRSGRRTVAAALPHWVFGYASLIWRANFPWRQRRRALVRDWSRRFWQGSRDHRGTIRAPGRVATLIATPGARCVGVAYLVDAPVLRQLDQRERDGYQRMALDIRVGDDAVRGITYVAESENPGFLGPAPLADMARQILTASGQSGSNREYLGELAAALEFLDVEDAHVADLWACVEALAATSRAAALGRR